MKQKRSNNKLKRVMTFPIRAMAKARDLYVDAMNTYADTGCYAGGASSFGLAVAVADPLPRSFSAISRGASSDVDLKELIRAASNSRAYKLDLAALNRPTTKGVPRSASVCMACIDEDKPCEVVGVDEDIYRVEKKKKKRSKGLFARSKSYALNCEEVLINYG